MRNIFDGFEEKNLEEVAQELGIKTNTITSTNILAVLETESPKKIRVSIKNCLSNKEKEDMGNWYPMEGEEFMPGIGIRVMDPESGMIGIFQPPLIKWEDGSLKLMNYEIYAFVDDLDTYFNKIKLHKEETINDDNWIYSFHAKEIKVGNRIRSMDGDIGIVIGKRKDNIIVERGIGTTTAPLQKTDKVYKLDTKELEIQASTVKDNIPQTRDQFNTFVKDIDTKSSHLWTNDLSGVKIGSIIVRKESDFLSIITKITDSKISVYNGWDRHDIEKQRFTGDNYLALKSSVEVYQSIGNISKKEINNPNLWQNAITYIKRNKTNNIYKGIRVIDTEGKIGIVNFVNPISEQIWIERDLGGLEELELNDRFFKADLSVTEPEVIEEKNQNYSITEKETDDISLWTKHKKIIYYGMRGRLKGQTEVFMITSVMSMGNAIRVKYGDGKEIDYGSREFRKKVLLLKHDIETLKLPGHNKTIRELLETGEITL